MKNNQITATQIPLIEFSQTIMEVSEYDSINIFVDGVNFLF